ncbi:MAG TPA: neutral zinc metallopeptidase [Gemmatimonas sp.]|nr:neutral zinc metallopeptidase [Gemmatimonas sp.]
MKRLIASGMRAAGTFAGTFAGAVACAVVLASGAVLPAADPAVDGAAASSEAVGAPSRMAWTETVEPDRRNPVRVTAADIEASNAKAAVAYGALVNMWTDEFANIGAEFAAPKLARYRGGPVRTRCGVIPSNNASYCFTANAIYFDDVFLAAQAKVAAQALRTDGDMVGVGIIAHEVGHAVAMQLGFRSRNSYANEAVADCLAGAFANRSDADGSLEQGDVEEAFFGMAMAGDPVLQPTGDADVDRKLAARLAHASHGTREQRMSNFQNGFEGGSGACMAQFRR